MVQLIVLKFVVATLLAGSVIAFPVDVYGRVGLQLPRGYNDEALVYKRAFEDEFYARSYLDDGNVVNVVREQVEDLDARGFPFGSLISKFASKFGAKGVEKSAPHSDSGSDQSHYSHSSHGLDQLHYYHNHEEQPPPHMHPW